MLASDFLIVSRTSLSTTRRCPFCAKHIEDAAGEDINFIVHCGIPSAEHIAKQAWADYVAFMHRI